jgi:hypothetical protein
MFTDAGAVNIGKASRGRFGADPQQLYPVWDLFFGWAAGIDNSDLREHAADNGVAGRVRTGGDPRTG